MMKALIAALALVLGSNGVQAQGMKRWSTLMALVDGEASCNEVFSPLSMQVDGKWMNVQSSYRWFPLIPHQEMRVRCEADRLVAIEFTASRQIALSIEREFKERRLQDPCKRLVRALMNPLILYSHGLMPPQDPHFIIWWEAAEDLPGTGCEKNQNK